MLTLSTGYLQAQVNGRTIRWSVKNQSNVNYQIRNDLDFLSQANWLLVDPFSGVTSTTVEPAPGDTLQIFDATLELQTDFDMTYLPNVILDFGSPRAGQTSTFIVQKNHSLLLNNTAKLSIRAGGQLKSMLDNDGLLNTYIKIGEAPKLLSNSTQDVLVNGPTYASSATPVSVSELQEGFVLGVLPLMLTQFDAKVAGGGVQLTWKTSLEYDIQFYLVEKSHDGRNFETLGRVNAKSGSSVSRDYSYQDAANLKGVAYYRVKAINADEKTTYSPIKAVRGSRAAVQNALYPNPASRFTNLILSEPEKQVRTVGIYSQAGQLASQKNVAPGTNTCSLDVSGLPNGNYVLMVFYTDGSRQTARLVVTH